MNEYDKYIEDKQWLFKELIWTTRKGDVHRIYFL